MRIAERLGIPALALVLTLGGAAALLAVSEIAYLRSTEAMREIDLITQRRLALESLERLVNETETSQRRFLLNGRGDDLSAYRLSDQALAAAVDRLASAYASNAELAPRFAALAGILRVRRDEFARQVAQAAAGRREEAITGTLAAAPDAAGEPVRARIDELATLELAQLAAARQRVADLLLVNRLGIDALALAGLVAVLLYLREVARAARQRRERQQAIRDERDRLEAEVQRRTAQLIALTRHLQAVREDERSRLARELHDELGALLTAAKLDAARVRARLGAREPEALERLAHLNETLNSGIALKRRIIEDLRPSALVNLGLVAALEIHAREFAEASGLEVDCRLEPVRLAPAAQLTAYRLVQEAFTNVARHAQARRVRVTLAARAGAALIEVQDDGRGFDPATMSDATHGLLGMRYRVEADGGVLQIESASGRGTCVRATLPEAPAAGVSA